MIYAIEKRKISGYGTVETIYEIVSYEGIYDNGIPYQCKKLAEFKTKEKAEKSMRKRNCEFAYERTKGQFIYLKVV